ncbi:hypothetical protein GCM10010423_29210 [Streptomyces levis]|uniref:Uncharacterized protein n=1 Tax=Streptomyces levis TaxID=285566 RepID=A0ABN3NS40_9ACTN
MLARPAVENGSFFRLEAIVPAAPKPRCSQPYFEGDSGDEGTQEGGRGLRVADPALRCRTGLLPRAVGVAAAKGRRRLLRLGGLG